MGRDAEGGEGDVARGDGDEDQGDAQHVPRRHGGRADSEACGRLISLVWSSHGVEQGAHSRTAAPVMRRIKGRPCYVLRRCHVSQ